MAVTGVRLLWNKSNIATTNKMRNFIVCTLPLFFIVMIALGRGIVEKRTIDGSNSIEI